MTDITLLGIRTCDTCKKAAKALEQAGHSVTFRDIRADPLDTAEWDALLAEFGDRLVNKNSTTYRGLSDWMKASEADAQLAQHPTLMKRPVLRADGQLHLGWDETVQAVFLN